ncbi:MAG: outer membrane lipoprotein LolB [Arenicella sp.]|nr:outer membrane lipoprotein LolB [Arenicella sp.]
MNACLDRFTVNLYRLLAAIVLLSFLAACQNRLKAPSAEIEVNWRSSSVFFVERQQYVRNLNTWQYSAKVGLSTPDLNEQANLIWEFSDQANSVRMFGPLGVGAIKLQFDKVGVVLSDNKGLLHRGNSAEQLLSRIVGWPIPIDALSSWMFVLPAKGATYRYALDENRQIERLEQLGWLIQYTDYRDYQGQLMPRKIVVSKKLSRSKNEPSANKSSAAADGKSAAANGQIVVKLITKSWKL